MILKVQKPHFIEDYRGDPTPKAGSHRKPLVKVVEPSAATSQISQEVRHAKIPWQLKSLPKFLIHFFYKTPISAFKKSDAVKITIPEEIIIKLPACNFADLDPVNFMNWKKPERIKELDDEQFRSLSDDILRNLPVELYRELTPKQAEFLIKNKLMAISDPVKTEILMEHLVSVHHAYEIEDLKQAAVCHLAYLAIIASSSPEPFININYQNFKKLINYGYASQIAMWLENSADFSQIPPDKIDDAKKKVALLGLLSLDLASQDRLIILGQKGILRLLSKEQIEDISPNRLSQHASHLHYFESGIQYLPAQVLRLIPPQQYQQLLKSSWFLALNSKQQNEITRSYIRAHFTPVIIANLKPESVKDALDSGLRYALDKQYILEIMRLNPNFISNLDGTNQKFLKDLLED